MQVDGKNVPTAVKVLSKHRVLDVSLGPAHSAALVEPGLVYTFGDNQYGQLACNNCKPRDVPAIVKALEEKTTTVILDFPNFHFLCFIIKSARLISVQSRRDLAV